MTGKVVHPHQRQAGPGGKPLGQHHPGHDPPDQARPRRHGDGVEIAQADPRLLQRGLDAKVQPLGMGAGGDFRHDAAEGRVQRRLARNDRGQHAAVLGHDRGGGVVATALDAKDGQGHG